MKSACAVDMACQHKATYVAVLHTGKPFFVDRGTMLSGLALSKKTYFCQRRQKILITRLGLALRKLVMYYFGSSSPMQKTPNWRQLRFVIWQKHLENEVDKLRYWPPYLKSGLTSHLTSEKFGLTSERLCSSHFFHVLYFTPIIYVFCSCPAFLYNPLK